MPRRAPPAPSRSTPTPPTSGCSKPPSSFAPGGCPAVELTEACLRRIEERNGGPPSLDGAPDAVNAWVRLYPGSRARAGGAGRRSGAPARPTPRRCCAASRSASRICTRSQGLPLTASSRVLDADTPATRRHRAWGALREQGMVLLGHTHTHEFAAGGTTDQVGNPHALHLIAGGSSGGSAAALAARMTPAALGSATRAARCAFRRPAAARARSSPRTARIPLDGIVPLAPSLDHPGRWRARWPTAPRSSTRWPPATAAVTPLLPPPADDGRAPARGARRSQSARWRRPIALTDRRNRDPRWPTRWPADTTRPSRRASDSARGSSSCRRRGRSSGTT